MTHPGENASPKRVAILHGAGYVGGELLRIVERHPYLTLQGATSRTYAGEPVWTAHPSLKQQSAVDFSRKEEIDLDSLDGILIAAEHGQGVKDVQWLLDQDFDGSIVDLSADFRYTDPASYQTWFDYQHPAPELLDQFVYGLPEVVGPYNPDTRWIANPGCFATGLALSIWPLAQHLDNPDISVSALTGASGSGTQPKSATHFPTREGNVRAYKILAHQHLPEVKQALAIDSDVSFVPVSGPWTRGIWGTLHVRLPSTRAAADVANWYGDLYSEKGAVRLWKDDLPELRFSVQTPYCDIGWKVADRKLVVGFALDNLLKGAASQAVQNLNLTLGLPAMEGLISESSQSEQKPRLH